VSDPSVPRPAVNAAQPLPSRSSWSKEMTYRIQVKIEVKGERGSSVDHLPSEHEGLSSNPISKTKQKTKVK
jgi:hypothetical protein